MASKKQFAQLKKGVAAWNKWRETNREIKPDLARANLHWVYLSGANLSGTNLSGANLSGTNLSGANLSGANLSGTNLSGANLSGTNLSETNFSGATLNWVNLIGVNLSGLDLSEANLKETNFTGANLTGANLTGANFTGANFSRTQALKTNFEDATFTRACIEDWNINSETSLNNVVCDYVYLKEDKQERRPSDSNKNFAPGEFTKLFQKALETVDLIFSDGIEWQAFLTSFQKLQIECGSDELTIQAIEKKSGGAFIIRVEVPPDADKAEVEKYLKREYKIQLKAIENRYRLELNAKDKEIEIYKQKSADIFELAKLAASRPINISQTQENNSAMTNITQSHSGSGDNVAGSKNITNNYNSQNLAEAAAEIQQLLEQLSKTYPTTTSKEKNIVIGEAIVQIESNPKLKSKVINALKAFGVETFKEAVNHPLINILVATIEGWQEAE